jgi:ribonuclease HI
MPWVRRRYRTNKAWVEVGDDGAYRLDERGLAKLRYKPDDEQHTYSVKPRDLSEVSAADPVDAPAGAVGPIASTVRGKRRGPAADSTPGRVVATAPDVTADTEDPDLPALVGREVQAWTDGACSGNPGPAGAGVLLLFREHRKEASIYLGEATNNIAELTAVREALRLVKSRDVPLRVMTDSTYAIGVLTGAMKAKANGDLVAAIRAELAAFPDVRLVKVEAHVGIEGNERADALAREAIRTKKTSVR